MFTIQKVPLISDAQPKLAIKSHFIKKISRWPISKIDSYLSKKRILDLDEAEVNLANKKLIYILNCGGRPFASKVAQLLATKSHRSGRKVILCEKTGRQKNVKKDPLIDISDLSIVSAENGIDLLSGNAETNFFNSSKFESTITKLMKTHDQIFVCSENNEAILGLMALKVFNPSVVMLARLRKTTRTNVKKVIATNL